MHVVLAGGGTAGHVEPALALADELRRCDPGVGVTALGTERGIETRLVPARGYDLALVPAVPVPRRPGRALLALPVRLRAAIRQTGSVLDRVHADVVVGFGGYVAAPAYLAARRRRVPVVVHEANARAGLANRLGARGAVRVLAAVPGTGLPRAEVIGIPLRSSVAGLDRPALRDAARAELGLAAELPTLLVFGGSQGARRINEALLGALPALADAGIQVLHAAGRANIDACPPAQPGRYLAVPYLDRMDLAYAAADLAVARAGAMTCAELAAVGLPAVLVPLPIGNGEQRLNARPLEQAGGAVLVADAELDATRLAAEALALLRDRPRLQAMAAGAASCGHRDAAARLAAIVSEVASGRGRA